MPGTVHIFDWMAAPLKNAPSGICAVFGGERFLKRLAIEFLIREIGGDEEDFSPSQYDSDTATWADVNDELSTRSLFGGDGPKIVIVDHADKFVKDNRDRLEDYADASGSGLLVLVVDSWASNTKLYKKIDKVGLQIRADAPTKSARSKQADDKKTAAWLIARAQSVYEFQLPAGGAQALIELTDCEFGRMDQELQKISLYADDQGKVNEATIKKVVGGWRSRTMWEAIDAAADGKAGKAIELLDQLLRSGEHPLALFGQLSWSLRRYATATELVLRQMRNGKKPNLEHAVKEAGFKAWGGEIETSQSRLRQLGRDRAKLMLDWLLEADMQLKRSHSKENRGRLVLEKLFIKMAKELGPQAA
ncbi:MAG: DNA polymerase-3 subunit delta [Mariniblastus sp.]|jgi:DNA polymerase-3 subunit delta